MPDILGDGAFGRDDGVICECGGKTYLVNDQGQGLCAYECETCGETFQVQYDSDDGDEYEPEFSYSDFDYGDYDLR